MIRYVPASEYILEVNTRDGQNRNRMPEDISHMLCHFSNDGYPDAVAEILGWEDYYSSIISCYNALRYYIKQNKLHLEIVIRGSKIYMHHF